MCEESTYFSIRTALSSNVTLTWPEQGDEDDTDYVHQIQVSIYPDPDSDDVELFNALSTITISASCAESEEVHSICPGRHFRLDATCSWSIKMTSTHTFGLVLRPAEDVLNALIPELVLRDDYKIFCIPQIRSDKGTGQGLRCALKDTVDQDSDLTSRQIVLPAISKPSIALPPTNETFEGGTAFHIALPLSSGDDPGPVLLFENNGTVVEEISRRGKGRVRKKIRNPCLHIAARQWERETRILGKLSHPHIVKALEWDPQKLVNRLRTWRQRSSVTA
jgi:hypothetical protein